LTKLAIACLLAFTSLPAHAALDLWSGSGPFPGRVELVAAVAGAPRVLLATTGLGWLLRSTDDGATWNLVPGVGNLGVSALSSAMIAPPLAPGVAFLATPTGLLRTTDAGLTWTSHDTASFWWSARIDADPTGQRVLAVVGRDVYGSTDGGSTWTHIQLGYPLTAVALDPSQPNVAYAGETYLERSTDFGLTWQRTEPNVGGIYLIQFIRILPTDPSHLYVAFGPTVRQSTDGGSTWSDLVPAAGSYPLWLAPASADGSRLLLGQQDGLLASSDAGSSWAPATDLQSVHAASIASDPADPDTFYAGTWAGVLRSSDAGTAWAALPTAPPADVWAVAGHPTATRTFFAGASGGLFRTTDDGVSWTVLGGIGHAQVFALLGVPATTGAAMLAGSQHGLYRSTDSGATWQLRPSFAESSVYGPIQAPVVALARSPLSRDLLYAATNATVYRSTDGGLTFDAPIPLLDTIAQDHVTALAVDPAHPDTVYAGVTWFLDRSTDRGATWKPMGYGVPQSDEVPTAIAVDPRASSRIWIGTDKALRRSTDDGSTWTDVTHEIGSTYFNRIVVDGATGSLYVATDAGTFTSTDGGDSWSVLGGKPHSAPLWFARSLVQGAADPRELMAGSLSIGVRHLTLGDPSRVDGDVNGDGQTDVQDVFSLLNFLFGDGPPPQGLSDANGDGQVDIADVFYLINYLFAGGPAPPPI
jgi:photosystem II stability/assembly factor-like uncharacterized protein